MCTGTWIGRLLVPVTDVEAYAIGRKKQERNKKQTLLVSCTPERTRPRDRNDQVPVRTGTKIVPSMLIRQTNLAGVHTDLHWQTDRRATCS
jgi:hypothetical protein